MLHWSSACGLWSTSLKYLRGGAGLLSCQARIEKPWQGRCGLTAPAVQAWVIVINMMEDEDSEVSLNITSDR